MEIILMSINKYIDHTLLKPESTQDQIDNLIAEAKEYNFAYPSSKASFQV